MKRFSAALIWGIFLLVAGLFLQLKGLGVFGAWGQLIWGALFAAAGIGFVIWFALDLARWWRAIPGFTLLGIGALLILQSRGLQMEAWSSPLALFGMALGFWAVLLARREHWWAVIPAGTLTVISILLRFWSELAESSRLAVLFGGIGLVFVLLYAIRFGQQDTRWAAIPAGALLLLSLVTVMQTLRLPALVADWWPLLLVVAGAGLIALALGLAAAPRKQTAPSPAPDFEAAPPAPGASVTETLPPASEPLHRPAAPPAPAAPQEKPIDIYELIKQQPPAAPPEPEAK